MKLTDLTNNSSRVALKALKEHFSTTLDLSKLDMMNTKHMLNKVRGLINETKSSHEMHSSHTSPAYLKLIFLEEALLRHYGELQANPSPRIVVENKKVEQSQVVLAAQEMVDSVQKMIVSVSDMLVKELPALVQGVENEIGTNEASSFSQLVTDALSGLQSGLTQAKQSLEGALGVITGEEGAENAFADVEQGAEEMPDMGAEEMPDIGAGEPEMGELPEEPAEEPEQPVGGVGRATR